jgi:hypothetical protein
MEYYLYLDESGDNKLNKIDPGFPVFLLCGVLFSPDEYQLFRQSLNEIKYEFFGHKNTIFHSRDIRKWTKDFTILNDDKLRHEFYSSLNTVISKSNHTIIASGIDKMAISKIPFYSNKNVYDLSLSFIIERAIFFLDDIKDKHKKLIIIPERRGWLEDSFLEQHFYKIMLSGTEYVSASRMKNYRITIDFRYKWENVNGLQLADLIAYPIARKIINADSFNPAYEILKNRFYKKRDVVYGLKIFPK